MSADLWIVCAVAALILASFLTGIWVGHGWGQSEERRAQGERERMRTCAMKEATT